MSTIVFKAEDTERKQTQKGKNYLRVKIEGGPWASVWGKQDANTILQNDGAFFKAEREDDETYGASLSKVSVSSDEEASASPSQPSGGKDSMSKEEWLEKNKRDVLERRFAGHCANLVAMMGKVEAKEVGFSIYDNIVGRSRALASSDVQWMFGGGTEEPF